MSGFWNNPESINGAKWALIVVVIIAGALVSIFEYRVSKLEKQRDQPRHLTGEKRERFIAALTEAKGKRTGILKIGTPNEALEFGKEIEGAMREAGLLVQIRGSLQGDHRGVAVMVASEERKSDPLVKVFQNAFKTIEMNAPVILDETDIPLGSAVVMHFRKTLIWGAFIFRSR